ncbi:MAG: T9SS type A sorting domain-containing protein [Ginsengibacter sp.]
MKKMFSLIILFFFLANVQAQGPGCTTNLLPVDGAINVNPYPSVTFQWTPFPGAVSYDIYVSTKVPTKQLIGNTSTDSFEFINGNYNTTYYWYAVPKDAAGNPFSTGSCSSSRTSFTTSATPPPPANDNCSGALDISSAILNGSTVGATQSMPAIVCNGFTGTANDDIWYQFTAHSSGTAMITMNGDPGFDGVLEVFSGACGSLTSLTCSDTSQQGGSEQILLNVTAGTNYKVRVYNFFSTLSTRGTFTIEATGSTLSVSFIYFRGASVGNENVLSWATATEENNKGFQVQYSFDGNHFSNMSFVNSKATNGTSSSTLNYQYSDSKSLGENVYYRLVQVDKDGHTTYSNIILIKGDKAKSLRLNAIYPNPAKNYLNLIVSSPVHNQINVMITDVTGKTVQKQSFSIVEGGNNLDMNIIKLPAGSYFVKAICNNGCETSVSKFVKQ